MTCVKNAPQKGLAKSLSVSMGNGWKMIVWKSTYKDGIIECKKTELPHVRRKICTVLPHFCSWIIRSVTCDIFSGEGAEFYEFNQPLLLQLLLFLNLLFYY